MPPRAAQALTLRGSCCASAGSHGFKAAVPHDFREEDLLHVLLLNEERDFAAWHAAKV